VASHARYRENSSIRIESLTDERTTLADNAKSTISEITRIDRDAKIIESSSTIFAKKSADLGIYLGKDEYLMASKYPEV
jgi:hypothetical protein